MRGVVGVEEPVDRPLLGLGVDSGVGHGLGPRCEPVIELIEVGDPDRLGFGEEPFPDEPVQPFLFPAALGRVGLGMHEVDAQHRARA